MADSTFYERRMQELSQAQVQHAANITGSPLLQRPQQGGNPMAQQPDQPQPDDTQEQMDRFHNTHFGQLTQHYEANDPHYGTMIKNLTDLSLALKDQVDNGYMPLAVANDKIKQFIHDHREGMRKGNGNKVLQGQMAAGALNMKQQQDQAQQQQDAANAQVPDAQVHSEDEQSAIAGYEGQGGGA